MNSKISIVITCLVVNLSFCCLPVPVNANNSLRVDTLLLLKECNKDIDSIFNVIKDDLIDNTKEVDIKLSQLEKILTTTNHRHVLSKLLSQNDKFTDFTQMRLHFASSLKWNLNFSQYNILSNTNLFIKEAINEQKKIQKISKYLYVCRWVFHKYCSLKLLWKFRKENNTPNEKSLFCQKLDAFYGGMVFFMKTPVCNGFQLKIYNPSPYKIWQVYELLCLE
jgi:hypothetical protein